MLGQYSTFGSGLTPAVRVLLIMTSAAFGIQIIADLAAPNLFTSLFGLSLAGIKAGLVFQPITYLFVHGGLMHIFCNLLGLFFFGPDTERVLGTRRFILLYGICGILAGLGWLAISSGVCIGASGAVFGILAAFAALFPDRPITLLVFFVLPVTLKARTMAIGMGVFTLVAMGTQAGNIAYAAHLAGGIAGYLYIVLIVKKRWPSRRFSPRQLWNDIQWRWHRRRFKVLSSSSGREYDVQDNGEPVSREDVDRVLDKINRTGIQSLSRQEWQILHRAGKKP